MSNDQPTSSPETLASFSERVTIDTLADRPSIPSFDASPREWQPETSLRLEGHFNRNPGGSPLNDYAGERVVAIIGPKNVLRERGVVFFDQNNQRIDTPLLLGEGNFTVVGLRDQGNGNRTITEGNPIVLPIMKTHHGRTALSVTETFVPETIKAGPLT